jgi:RNA polymerase sigma-70 factor (ECF subfamily)
MNFHIADPAPLHGSDSDPTAVRHLIADARNGCPASLGQLFEVLRAQLAVVAAHELPDALRAKIGPSDLVQETAIDMQRDITQFRGSTVEECFAWLRAILRNNIVDAVRYFELSQKRDLAREESLEGSARADGAMACASRSPDGSAIRHEDAAAVARALTRLHADHRRVIELRYWKGLTFGDIGVEMSRSADAVRKLWYRAVERLSEELAVDSREARACRAGISKLR